MTVSLAQFAFNTVRAGVSAREGLRQAREAGLQIRDATWFRMVGEARAHYAGRITELAKVQFTRPDPSDVQAIPTKVQRGFRQYVDVWVRRKGSNEPYLRPMALIKDTLVSRQQAVDEAVAKYRSAVGKAAGHPAPFGTLPDEEVVGGVYTATLEFIPESEFAG